MEDSLWAGKAFLMSSILILLGTSRDLQNNRYMNT